MIISCGCQGSASKLHAFVRKGQKDKVIDLLSMSKGGINELDKNGIAPLHYACDNGDVEMTKLLLDNWAIVDIEAKHTRCTPLIIATLGDHKEIVNLLLEYGANINHKDATERTALTLVALKPNLNMLEFIISNGADVNTKGISGMTPLREAAQAFHEDIVKYLLENGANINERDDAGYTPLMNTILRRDDGKKRIDTIRLLLEMGADIEITAGVWSATSIAEMKQDRVVLGLLDEYRKKN